jgi:diguanylate cyclase
MFTDQTHRLQDLLERLRRASLDHGAWYDELIGTLLCHTPGDPGIAGPPGPGQCRFGRWYREAGREDIGRQPAFQAIDVEHRHVHDLAERLTETARRGEPVDRHDFDDLSGSESRLRLELDTLRHELEASLEHRDTLTGAYEREALLPELREWHELARRGVQSACIAFLDLDHFKQVNDRFGHLVGDRLLAKAAGCIAGQLRPYDRLFRYGGDEFVILLPAVTAAAGREVAERTLRRLAATPLVAVADGTPLCVTGSCGVADLDPAASVEESLERADTALLLAKSAGRNRALAWDPAVTTQRDLRALDPSVPRP